MKRCPDCGRDYNDDSLSYCLDDGSELLFGPAFDDPRTAIFEADDPTSEARTRPQIHTTNIPSDPGSTIDSGSRPFDKRLLLAPVALAAIVLAGFAGYRYLSSTGSKQIDSIAVMPFVNESGNTDVDYLSDGMTETLINSLTQLPNLNVKPRSSTFRYRGREADAKLIGRELGVETVLNGRLVQRGDEITLFLSLIDTGSENQIWGKQYSRKLASLVALQSELVRDVSESLKARLSGIDEQGLGKGHTIDPEAYQLYLKGRYHARRLTLPETQKAISYFEQALEIDPNYALAYVALARAYVGLALGSENPPKDTFQKAKAATQRALQIEPQLPEAIVASGVNTFWYDWDWEEAERLYKQALAMDPNSAEVHWAYAHLLSNIGRYSEALPMARLATELEPLDLRTRSLEAQFLVHAGKLDEALARLQEVFDLDPHFWMAHLFASSAYIQKGMYQEAVAEAQRATELSPLQTTSVAMTGHALARSGKTDEARALLNELLKLSEQRFVPPYHIALLYHGLGDDGKAFEWLEKGYEQRDPKMTFLKVEPKWNDLRGDPRFQELLRKMGFPP